MTSLAYLLAIIRQLKFRNVSGRGDQLSVEYPAVHFGGYLDRLPFAAVLCQSPAASAFVVAVLLLGI